MATVRVFSATLPRAFLGPVASVPRCVGVGVGVSPRYVSSWTPRERFAQTKRIDKLHKKQKVDNRIEPGGSKHITTLRKCAGDLEALRTHILEALKLEPSFVDPRGQKKQNVVINRLTNQLIIRGWRGAEVKEWCRLAGF
ncbi:hypothetical protein DV738_g2325, partial [Chaetothyriales sp. CBS 135597]